jgi:ketosteroid isomerase-like protein
LRAKIYRVPTDNVEIVRRAFERLEEDGYEALLPFIHADFEVTTTAELAAEPDTYRGPEGIRRYFESFYEAMDTITFEPGSFHRVGDNVVVEFTLRARGRASGIEAEQHGVQVWKLRDGQAIRLELFTDLDQALSAARGDTG